MSACGSGPPRTQRDEQSDAVRFDLLKKTYRIEQTADLQLFVIADDLRQDLSLEAAVDFLSLPDVAFSIDLVNPPGGQLHQRLYNHVRIFDHR